MSRYTHTQGLGILSAYFVYGDIYLLHGVMAFTTWLCNLLSGNYNFNGIGIFLSKNNTLIKE